MGYRIMLLLKPRIKQYCEQILGSSRDDVDIIYREYNEFSELISIFLESKTQYDGFITSGYIPWLTLKHYIPAGENIPTACFDIEVEHVYQMLLKLMMLNEQTDVNRIGIDFLEDGYTLREALTEEKLAVMADRFCQRLEESHSDEMEQREEELLKKYENRLKNRELDLILTQFHSVLKLGELYGVDSYYINPSIKELNRTFSALRQKMEMKRMKENISGAIVILPVEKETWDIANEERERCLFQLKQAVMTLNKLYMNSLILKEGYNGYEIYTNSMLIKKLTDNCTTCGVLPLLKQEMNFKGVISYGIGTTMNQARMNAWEAAAYGKKVLGKEQGSFLMDESENFFLLDASPEEIAAQPAESSKYLREVASNVRLSVETISKLASMMKLEGSDEVTASQIVKSLGISPRTASKILTNLLQYGYADMIGQESLGGKGRPVKHYRLKITI